MDPLSGFDQELERRLRELALAMTYPPTPTSVAKTMSTLRSRARPRRWWRSPLVAFAALLLVAAAAAAAINGLPGLRFSFTDVPPSPHVVDDPLRIRAVLGRAGTLDEARTALGDDLRVPDLLGPPDELYIGSSGVDPRVALVYLADGDEARLAGDIAFIVTEWRGGLARGYANKWLDQDGGIVDPVTVQGWLGYWFSGTPHVLEYIDGESGIRRPMSRLVGNALVWQIEDVVYRIETPLDLAATQAIAESMRPPPGTTMSGG